MSKSLSEFLNLLEVRGLSWCRVTLGPSGGFSLHQGEMVHFFLALAGSLRISGIRDGRIDLAAGDIAFTLSGEALAIRNSPEAACAPIDFLRHGGFGDEPHEIRVGEPGAAESLLLCGALKPRWPGGLPRKSLPAALVLRAGDTMLRADQIEQAAIGPGAAILLTRIASVLLTDGLRSDARSRQVLLLSGTRDPIERALQLIERQPDRRWTIAQLARYVGLGRSSFAARFLKETGKTPGEVIIAHRMVIAADLLARGELSIGDVGRRVGYASEAAFSRRILRHFGEPPGALRAHGGKARRGRE